MKSERFKTGWGKLKEIDGEAGEKVIESLKEISPDLGTYIIEYAFGDIYSRDGLDLKSKEIAVVAALTAMGNAQPQLKVHINGALNTGSSINEVKEVILQMSVYSGFPSSINAMNALKEVLAERKKHGIKDEIGKTATKTNQPNRLKYGEQELSKLDSLQVERLKMAYNDFSPELVKFTLEYGYADIFSRDNLNEKYRQIATISALTALGTAQPQLKFHINAGLNIGLTETEIKEIMLLMTVYSGFPSAINGTNTLKEVLAERIRN
ncbi:carboxymuconolactone decarboxylase [Pedobacter frigoris]|uniref:Carboxymuconolactone decarboxylase n=2 Tax=Pedobacter frigoris TaxID=2571272 RepID=A0A4U1CP74_9SPHI|nr:carboxymuconolactone decarboxylase [Pedobacter frigoris]